jgi:hypothetical protein
MNFESNFRDIKEDIEDISFDKNKQFLYKI